MRSRRKEDGMHRRGFLLGAIGAAVATAAPRVPAQSAADFYTEVFYRSGALNIQAYL